MNAKNALARKNNKSNNNERAITFFIIAILLMLVLMISLVFAMQTDKSEGLIKKQKDVVIKDKIIENKEKGRIKFNNNISVNVMDVEENPNVYLDNNLIAINTEELPELNQPAMITFYNLSFESTPAIFYSEGFTTKLSEVIDNCVTYSP